MTTSRLSRQRHPAAIVFLIFLLTFPGLSLAQQSTDYQAAISEAFQKLQQGEPEGAIKALDKKVLAADASGQARLLRAIAHFLDEDPTKGQKYANEYLAIEKDPDARSDAQFQFGNALMSAQIEKARSKKPISDKTIQSAITYFRDSVASDGSSSHNARLPLASALMLYAGRPADEVEAEVSKDYFEEAYGQLRRFLASETDSEKIASARFLLCGSPKCTPLPVAEVPPPTPEEWRAMAVHDVAEGDVSPPVRIGGPGPEYTEAARQARIQGQVVLQCIIGKEGTILQTKALSGLPYGLTEAAAEAVRQWTFEPAHRDGQPVDVYYNLAVNFRLK